MTDTHTPGPWRAIGRGLSDTIRMDIVSDAESLPFAPAFVAGDILPQDARLIAAAPAMLAALECLRPAMIRDGDPHNYLPLVDAVLAQARGEQASA